MIQIFIYITIEIIFKHHPDNYCALIKLIEFPKQNNLHTAHVRETFLPALSNEIKNN